MESGFFRQIFEEPQISNFLKIRNLGAEIIHENRRTNMTLFAILRTLNKDILFHRFAAYNILMLSTSTCFLRAPPKALKFTGKPNKYLIQWKSSRKKLCKFLFPLILSESKIIFWKSSKSNLSSTLKDQVLSSPTCCV